MSWIFRSTSSHTLCVLGQTTPSDLNVVNPSSLCHIDHRRVTTYPLTQSLGGACCFDRPSQGGALYTPTCPILIVRSSLDVYKPWWNCGVRSDLFVWCLLRNIFLFVCVCPPDLTPYDWPLYRTLNLPIDELAWETSFHSDIFRTTDWYARVTCGVYRTSRDWYVYGHYVMNCV